MTRLKQIATEVIEVLQKRITGLDQTPVTRKTQLLTVNDLYRVATGWTHEEQTLCRFVTKSIMLDLATILMTALHHLDYDNPIQGADAAFAPPGPHATIISDAPVRRGSATMTDSTDAQLFKAGTRHATLDDLPLLVSAQKNNTAELGFLTFQALKEKLGSNRVIVTQTPANRVVGFLIHGAFDTAMCVTQIWVDPAFRREGIGSELLRQFERKASEFGALRLRARIRSDFAESLAFYNNAGYEPVSTVNRISTVQKLLSVADQGLVTHD